jgi:hypothetical protein
MEDKMTPFELNHCGNAIVISDLRCDHEAAKTGNPYNTTFNMAITSEAFKGLGDCEYDIKEFIRFAKQINDLYRFKCKKVEFKEIGYGSYVLFEMDRAGHITISGEIFGGGRHSMKFEFMADQTSLKPFADSLRQVYNYQP